MGNETEVEGGYVSRMGSNDAACSVAVANAGDLPPQLSGLPVEPEQGKLVSQVK